MKRPSLPLLCLLVLQCCLRLLPAQSIPNAGFEENTYAGQPEFVWPGYASQNRAIPGWSSTAANRMGLNSSAGPFADNGNIPQGTTVAFVQSAADQPTSITTTISGLTAGRTYNLRFRANARKALFASTDYYPLLTVQVANLNTTLPVSPVSNTPGVPQPYRTYSVNFTASSAEAFLTFTVQSASDGTVLLDELSVTRLIYNPWQMEHWSGDASLRITPASTLWAYRFTSNLVPLQVNGVAVEPLHAPSVASVFDRFSLAPTQVNFPFAINNTFEPGSASVVLAEKHVYLPDNDPDLLTGSTLQIQGLQPHTRYTVSLYSLSQRHAADPAASQPGFSITSGSDILSVQPERWNKAVRVDYSFNPEAGTTRTIRIKSLTSHAFPTISGIVLNRTPFEAIAVQGTAPGSLAAVLEEAAAAPGQDLIQFVQSMSGIRGVLASEIVVNDPAGVTVDATTLPLGTSLDGSGAATRLMRNVPGSRLTIRGMSFTGGSGQNTGNFPGSGGAICNEGNLTLERCTFSGNRVMQAIHNGAAILSSGPLTMTNCTVAGNTSHAAAITMRPHVASGPAAANIVHSTIAGNESGGISLFDSASLRLEASIVHQQGELKHGISSPSGPVTSSGPNLVNNSYIVGPFSGPAFMTDEPGLMPLGQYGGGSLTMPPMHGSPAINAFIASAPVTDQRGVVRIAQNGQYIGGAADIGAVEAEGIVTDHWLVREYLSPAALNDIDQAEAFMANPGSAITRTRITRTINFSDPEAGAPGYFGNDIPFATDNAVGTVAPRDDSDFALTAVCAIQVHTTGDYTFGFAGDDGARLRISGASFYASTRINPANPLNPAHNGNTLTYPGITAASDTLGVVNLRPGIYQLEFTWFERGGGAGCEVFMASGAKTVIDRSFQLVGQPQPRMTWPSTTAPWKNYTAAGVTTFTQAINSAKALLAPHMVPLPTVETATINFSDPQAGGGGHGLTTVPFPNNTPADDNNFAFGAATTISIPAAGWYTFCILADDSSRLELEGSSGWTNPNQDPAVQLLPNGIQFQSCCRDVFTSVYLEARSYRTQFIMNEVVGQAYAGLWVAPGLHRSFDAAAFILVGAPPPAAAPLTLAPAPESPMINDNWAKALPLAGAYCEEILGYNRLATVQPGEFHDKNRSLWWKWTAPGPGWLIVERGNTASPLQNLGISQATDQTGFTAILPANAEGAVRMQILTAGQEHRIMAGGKSASNVPPDHPLSFNLRFIPAAQTTAGSASSPIALPGQRSIGVSGDNTCSTSPHAYAADAVWYSWTAPIAGLFEVQLVSRASLKCSVFTGSAAQPPLASGGAFTFSATAGMTYRLAVHSAAGNSFGPFSLILRPAFSTGTLKMALAGNAMQLSTHGEPGYRYLFFHSNDLQSWEVYQSSYGTGADINTSFPRNQNARGFFKVQRQGGFF